MQNISQNKFNRIAEMPDQSRDELELVAKIRRIKDYERMKKEELIIYLYDNKISDIWLRKLVRLLNDKGKHGPYDHDDPDYNGITDKEILLGEISEEDYYEPIFVKSSFKSNYKYY